MPARYAHVFNTTAEFEAEYNGSAYHEPWVSYNIEEADQGGTGVAFNKGTGPAPTPEPWKEHDYIEVAGLAWATCNVGASNPTGNGNYYAWSEINTKANYTGSTYTGITPAVGANIAGDARYDAVAANWGNGWRMPTSAEAAALFNAKTGLTVTSSLYTLKFSGGKELTFPRAGIMNGTSTQDYPDLVSIYLADVELANQPKAFMYMPNPSSPLDPSTAYVNGVTNAVGPNGGCSIRGVHVITPSPNYDYVDLGLASGTKWAPNNLGAVNPEDSGNFYAWGEIGTKSNYTWSTYRFGTESNLTKYNASDGKTVLDASDDIAYLTMGEGYAIPTTAQCNELITGTNVTWTTMGGVPGAKFTNKSDSSKYIFIPAAGYMSGTTRGDLNEWFIFWTRNLDTTKSQAWSCAGQLNHSAGSNWGDLMTYNLTRETGKPIRGVKNS